MLTLRSVVSALRRRYGKPPPPVSRDPFHLILWEQVGYLVPDIQRRRAFAALRAQVGLHPGAVLAAPRAKLEAITRLGGPIAVRIRASRLRDSAELVLGRWDGELRAAVRLPLYSLLRRHGQELCRRTAPACGLCPLRIPCPSSSYQDVAPDKRLKLAHVD